MHIYYGIKYFQKQMQNREIEEILNRSNSWKIFRDKISELG